MLSLRTCPPCQQYADMREEARANRVMDFLNLEEGRWAGRGLRGGALQVGGDEDVVASVPQLLGRRQALCIFGLHQAVHQPLQLLHLVPLDLPAMRLGQVPATCSSVSEDRPFFCLFNCKVSSPHVYSPSAEMSRLGSSETLGTFVGGQSHDNLQQARPGRRGCGEIHLFLTKK